MTRPAASVETCKSVERDSNVPDGLEDANVAFTTRMTETTVMYHLRAVDQFLGFSMSLGPNSRRPSSLRWISSEASMSLVLYGFAVGRDKKRSSFSIVGTLARMGKGSTNGIKPFPRLGLASPYKY